MLGGNERRPPEERRISERGTKGRFFFYCKPILASSVLLLVNGPTEHWLMCYRVVTDRVTVWSIKSKLGSAPSGSSNIVST